MDTDVSAYLESGAAWQVETAATLRQLLFETAPDLVERLQYKKPHYLRNGHYAAVLTIAKGKVSLMLFNATDVPAEAGFIRSMGDGERKSIDFTEGTAVDRERIAAMIRTTTAGLA